MAKKQSSPSAKARQRESQTPSPKPDPAERAVPEPTESSGNGHHSQTVEFNARVARKAYELFERRGGESGRDVEDWLEAERLIRHEQRHQNQ
jgi:Protein of unknown function (DUF2934)